MRTDAPHGSRNYTSSHSEYSTKKMMGFRAGSSGATISTLTDGNGENALSAYGCDQALDAGNEIWTPEGDYWTSINLSAGSGTIIWAE